MPLKKDIGQWISHFEKSDAPQFKGKTKEERKNMALAAYRAKYGSLNEERRQLDTTDFKKVVQAVKSTGHPATVMLVPKWNEIEIITGMDAPDELINDINKATAPLGYSHKELSMSGDSSSLGRGEYSEIEKVNGGHMDYRRFEESVKEGEKSFADYDNKELAAYVKNTEDKEAAKELHKRSQKIKGLSRTDVNEQADHVNPMVAKAYKDYIKAKKDSAADVDFAEDPEKAYRYYSKKLNNTYSTKSDRDAIEAILKKKYGSALEEASKEEMDKFAKFQKDLQKTMSTQGWKDLEDRAKEERKEREARKSKPVFTQDSRDAGALAAMTGAGQAQTADFLKKHSLESIKLALRLGSITKYELRDAITGQADPVIAKKVSRALQDTMKENEEDQIDTITMDVPLFIRILEYSREDAQADMDLHDLAEKAIAGTKQQGTLSMDDYDMLVGDLEQIEELSDKADLNKDGKLSSYEKKRGAAIEKAMAKAKSLKKEVVKIPTNDPNRPDGADVLTAKKLSAKDTDFEFVKKGMAESLNENAQWDYEGKMAQAQLISIVKNARDLFGMIGGNTQLKSWIQSKLTKAEDYLNSVRTYIEGESISSAAPLMRENENVKDESGESLRIGDVVKAGDGGMYQIIFSYGEGKAFLTPYDIKKGPINLRKRIYFDTDQEQDKVVLNKLHKVMSYAKTKGGFMG